MLSDRDRRSLTDILWNVDLAFSFVAGDGGVRASTARLTLHDALLVRAHRAEPAGAMPGDDP